MRPRAMNYSISLDYFWTFFFFLVEIAEPDLYQIERIGSVGICTFFSDAQKLSVPEAKRFRSRLNLSPQIFCWSSSQLP